MNHLLRISALPLLRIVALIVLLLAACQQDPNDPGQPDDQPDLIPKSFKRGLSYDLRDSLDLEALRPGVSWWYNWSTVSWAPGGYYTDHQMEFIPMLWGGNSSLNDVTRVKTYILDHPEIEYLLVMNEPNLVDQANRTPQQAATDWIIYEQVITDLENQGRSIALVGPAMNWGTLTDYWDPVVWLDAFYERFEAVNGREPRIDFLAFHWYDYGLSDQLDRLQKYGKQIWITEMANWNANIDSYDKQILQMQQMVSLCESREDVFRYAWFIGRGHLPDQHFTYLFAPDPGELNALGQVYINLPYAQ